MIVHQVLGRRPELHPDRLSLQLRLHIFTTASDGGRRIGVIIHQDMGGSDQPAIAQIDESPYQPERIFHILSPIIDARDEVGMHVATYAAEIYSISAGSFKKCKHRS